MSRFYIDPNIKKAETLPASFYKDETIFNELKDKVFRTSWHWVGDMDIVPLTKSGFPFQLLEGYLTEPLLLMRDEDDKIRCMSNVCTHRGNLVVHHPGVQKQLFCMYHGRRFALDGTFKSMPEFEDAEDFPRACDSLHQFSVEKWNPFLFVGLEPSFDFSNVLKRMQERVGFLPLEQFRFRKDLSKDYLVNCHWALYCDNYLEGFHIPFVHSDLNDVLDYGSYTTEIYDHMNLQVGYAKSGEEVFELPKGHMDYGSQIGAYYFWVFPNMMFNFYPWGLSINIVKPIDMEKTKVSFLTYLYDENKLHSGAGALLDKVEREDEFVVEGVHQGLKSSYYKAGRFSPTREQGVHHFHRLLAQFLG